MSKSRKRVENALAQAALDTAVVEMDGDCTTAAAAAQTLSVEVDQIAKSVLLRGQSTETLYLFITAGSRAVDLERAKSLTGEPLDRPDAALIRRETGFAIGGVAPVGHLCDVRAFFDPRLHDFTIIWAAAGTPRHVFSASPDALQAAANAESATFSS